MGKMKGNTRRSTTTAPRRKVVGCTLCVSLIIAVAMTSFDSNNQVSMRLPEIASVTGDNLRCIPPYAPRPMKIREEMGSLLEEMNFTTGAEVGVKQGDYAENTLSQWKSCKHYKLIDLWAHQENYKDVANVEDHRHNQFYEEAKAKLQPWSAITEYYRMYSTEAAKKIPAQSLDYVYIDARHDYCGCLEDVESYWPLVKPGGIMAGHDFITNEDVRGQDWSVCMDGTINPTAVKGAVLDFFRKRGLTVSVVYKTTNFQTWMVQKPVAC